MPLGASDLSRLSHLLDVALALAPSQRAAWLAALPEDDRRLEGALRRMLASQSGKAEHFLHTMPRVAPEPDDTVAHAGDVVGAYRLVRKIASGGMGSVWLAERVDGALRRQVALKLPHLAWGAGLAERMARERDIGALLEHPHIARLYDAGLDPRGRPFLAFEFIDGVAIDTWCHGQELSVRARLRLFQQVTQAVAYAHTRLVVHRDLKPSNVMVTADGQVHLLDFGIAKLLQEGRPEDTGLTQALGQAMTPHYASPEQLRGQAVTVASDVYSLGVLLYELLTGQRPHQPKRASIAALEEAILQAEPLPASKQVGDPARARALRGDVDAILAKALRREVERRYPTVDALADDLQRHLDGEPVRARPATAGYRLGKFVARSRAGLALGAVAALSIAGATGFSLSKAGQAREAAARASAVKDFVLDTFRVDASTAPVKLDLRRTTRAFLLQRGAGLIDAQFSLQPALQAELHGVVSALFDEMANFELAERHAARRMDVLINSDALPADKAAAAMAMSQVLLKLGRSAQSEAPAVNAMTWAQGDRRLSTLARLQLIASLAAQAKPQPLSKELDLLDAQLAAEPARASIERAMALNGRAALASMTGHTDQAVAHARQAVAVAAEVEGPASANVLNLRWNLWRTLIDLRRVAEARELGASIIADLRQLGGPQDSTAAFAEIYYAATLFALDPEHRLSFDVAEAMVLADRAIVKARGCRGIADAGAWSDYFLGWLYLSWHDFERAEPLLSRAIARIAPVGDESTLIPYAPRALAWAWIVRGDHARGEQVLQVQLSLMARHSSPLAERTRASLAFSRSMQGRHDEALELLGPAPTGRYGTGTPDPRALEIAVVRAGALADRGEAGAALAALPPAPMLAMLAGADGGRRGEALCASGRAAEGLAMLDAYLAGQAAWRSADSPFLARTRAVEGLCALASGDAAQAASLARRSRQAFQAQATVSAYFKQPLDKLEGALAAAPSAARAQR